MSIWTGSGDLATPVHRIQGSQWQQQQSSSSTLVTTHPHEGADEKMKRVRDTGLHGVSRPVRRSTKGALENSAFPFFLQIVSWRASCLQLG